MSYHDYEPVIGLEIHAQLKTSSKIFSSDSTEFDASDNFNTSIVSLGMPGALPVLNEKVLEYSVLTGLALNCSIRKYNVFARKNYFYPDLPKGYQISQFEQPICEKGYVEFLVEGEPRRINITRAHMEEDAGKSTHHGDYSLINFNRAGVPLLEIVSEPEIRSAKEAAEYARMIKTIVEYLGVCDGNLEQGSLRCDCNVSVRKVGDAEFGERVEIKNINSFRFIEKAIDYEIHRQIDLIDSGQQVDQETRLYDSAKNKTYTMRKKEDAHDYRYFPDPDLPAIHLDEKFIEGIRQSLPELPFDRLQRFTSELQLSASDAGFLVSGKELADYFESVAAVCGNAKSASHWVVGELQSRLNDESLGVGESKITAAQLGQLIQLIDAGELSGKLAKKVFAHMWQTGEDAPVIIEREGLVQIKDTSAIEGMVDEVIEKNPDQVEQYRAGKHKVMGFFVGQVMKASKGQASPDVVNQLLKEKLK